MASPITVTTTAAVVAPFNRNRKTISFQNTGANIVYVKKQIPGAAASVPSATNYDFMLPIAGAMPGMVTITSAASFMAVSAAATSLIAVFETAPMVIV